MVTQAPGDEKKYGSQNTDGSTSIRDFLPKYREAGATVRALLEAAAAKQWNVPVAEVEAQNGRVVHASSKRALAFGKLVATASALPIPAAASLILKKPSQFRYIGKDVPGVDLRAMTTGQAMFGQDLRRDGMKVAVIARPPVYGGKVATRRLERGREGARRGADRPPARGQPAHRLPGARRRGGGGEEHLGGDTGPPQAQDHLDRRPQRELRLGALSHAAGEGSAQAGQGRALAGQRSPRTRHRRPRASRPTTTCPTSRTRRWSRRPPCAVFENGRCDTWSCTQNPGATRETVAQALGIPVENVASLRDAAGRRVRHGSRSRTMSVEAALLAREMGAPVKVMWTREDDIQHDFFHTVAAEHLEGAVDSNGKVTAWLQRSALPSIGALFAPNVLYQAEWEVGQGMTDFPYAVPNLQEEMGPAPAHARIGWYRSVVNIPHAFAIGSFIDELAHAAGKDPKEFLLELLGPDRIVDMSNVGLTGKPWNYDASFESHPIDTARLRGVVELATSQAGWGQPLPAGRGRGLAVHRSFLSYVAMVIEVQANADGSLSIPRVDVAADGGFIANPDRVKAQFEGATIMGISNALYGEVTFRAGPAGPVELRPVQGGSDGCGAAGDPGPPRAVGREARRDR